MSSHADSLFARFLSEEPDGGEAAFERWIAAHDAHAAELRELYSGWRALAQLRGRAELDAQRGAPGWSSESTARLLEKLAAHSARGARYEERSPIGAGGMGEVHEVWDDDLRRTLARKVIKDELLDGGAHDSALREFVLHRFFEEAQITAQLGHPGIVPVHEMGVDASGRPFFTMSRVRGLTLGEVFAKVRAGEDGWSLPRALGVLQRVCETMAFAHSKGVVHRDLKPANVMVGEFGEVYVMDWGLARVLGASPRETVSTDRQREIRAQPGTPLASLAQRQPGTIFYMPPEQARGAEVDARADVYAIGAMLYELLTGRIPYANDGAARTYDEVRVELLAAPPVPVESLAPRQAPELVAICECAMARERDERYPDMLAMSAELRAFLEGRVVRAHKTGAWAELTKWVRRNRATAGAVVGGVTLLTIASIAFAVVMARKNEDLGAEKQRAELATIAATVRAREAVAASNLAQEREREAQSARETALARQSEAEEANRLAQTRLADNYAHLAQLAGQRGRWRESLAAVEAARAEEHVDEIALGIQEAKSLAALVRNPEAQLVLDGLLARADLGSRTGTVLLMRGDLAMGGAGTEAEALDFVGRALEAELAPAERNFARGILAATTPEALEFMQASLRDDPFHRGAMCHELTLLVFLGRMDEALARADSMARAYPEDPEPYAVRALCYARLGDGARADAELERLALATSQANADSVRTGVDVLLKFSAALPLEFWIGTKGPEGEAPKNANVLLTNYGSSFVKYLGKENADPLTVAVANPNLPALREGIAKGVKALVALAAIFGNDPKRTDRLAAEALAVHPDGVLHFIRATSLIMVPTKSREEMLANFRIAEGEYRRAYETPSLVPGVARAARYWSAYAEILLTRSGIEGVYDEMLPLARENCAWLAKQPDLTVHECAILASETLRLGLEPTLAEPLVARWEALDDSGAPQRMRVRIALARGAHGEALDRLEPLLSAKPDDEGLIAFREQALAGIRELAKRLQLAESAQPIEASAPAAADQR